MKIGKRVFYVILASIVVFAAFGFIACDNGENNYVQLPPIDKTVIGTFRQEDYLMVSGKKVRTNYGKGEEFMLRGTNAGGYLLIEQWMTAITNGLRDNYDHKTVTDVFNDRFGEDTTRNLWKYYRDGFWTKEDFANCAEMGMTALRLPFSYMNVCFGDNYDFTQLDFFVEGAAEYGIYTILDLHGAYGSQNGRDHSGEQIHDIAEVDFYGNEEKMLKNIELWSAITEHYKDNPAVAAFDILNEPGELGGETSERHWEFFDRVYDAIRAIDNDRIVIFESCWDAENLPHPNSYGWENCIYSYHLYANTDKGSGADVQGEQYLDRIERAINANYGVPNYLGEFNCYNNQEAWEYVFDLLNEKGWHWTSWTYKVNFSGAWGIYNTSARSVDPAVDSVEEIYAKWKDIKTRSATSKKSAFKSGMTLFDVMAKACKMQIV